MSSPSVQKARIGHGNVAWREAGTGSALVFLHGIAANGREWLPMFARLAREFRVIAWDCPGYGGSDPLPVGQPAVNDYAAVLAGLLDHLELTNVGIVGDWLGGMIAGALAARQPERVDLMLLSGMKVKPSEHEANEFLAWLQDLLSAGGEDFGRRFAERLVGAECEPAARAWIASMAAELNPIGFGRACHMLANTDGTELFRTVKGPLFLVYGEHDQISPATEARAIERHVRGTITEIVVGAGHVPAVEKPDLFHRSLRAFLRTARWR